MLGVLEIKIRSARDGKKFQTSTKNHIQPSNVVTFRKFDISSIKVWWMTCLFFKYS